MYNMRTLLCLPFLQLLSTCVIAATNIDAQKKMSFELLDVVVVGSFGGAQ